MSRIDKKSPLRVPNGYFEYFEKNMEKLIKSTDTKDGFMTPPNYLQKAEDQILNNINYSKGENTFVFEKLWKIVAAAASCYVDPTSIFKEFALYQEENK